MKNNKLLIIVFAIIGLFLFYWFQWRPVTIRSNCHKWIVDLPGNVENLTTDSQIVRYKALFESCLHEKGIK